MKTPHFSTQRIKFNIIYYCSGIPKLLIGQIYILFSQINFSKLNEIVPAKKHRVDD